MSGKAARSRVFFCAPKSRPSLSYRNSLLSYFFDAFSTFFVQLHRISGEDVFGEKMRFFTFGTPVVMAQKCLKTVTVIGESLFGWPADCRRIPNCHREFVQKYASTIFRCAQLCLVMWGRPVNFITFFVICPGQGRATRIARFIRGTEGWARSGRSSRPRDARIGTRQGRKRGRRGSGTREFIRGRDKCAET